MSNERSSALRVGVLVILAMATLAAAVFLIGDQNNLFRRKHSYLVRFERVAGLQAGNPVQLNGVSVGQVKSVVLPQDPAESRLQVTITVDARYRERMRGDSRARIKTLGLLGDKYIDLTAGTSEAPETPNGGEIVAAEPTDVDRLINSGEDVVENIVSISVSLKEILGRIEDGEGVLGELMRKRQPGEAGVTETLAAMLDAVERASNSLQNGRGPLARLLHDETLAAQVADTMTRLNALTVALESGDGLVPSLLHDTAMREQLTRTLDNMERASSRLVAVADALESGDGLLPKLLHDEAFARQLTDELTGLLERLNLATARITEGDGTVARLIEDPAVYEAINDVVIGIDESKLLRWLIRNRQKAGIKKRYRDTQSATDSATNAGEPPSEQPE